MKAAAGTGHLLRLILRRDRWLIPVWIGLPALLVALTAVAFEDLYPTPESRRQFVAFTQANPGITAFLGPIHGSEIGALTAWRTAILGVVIAGIVSVFMVIRHTRAEEAAGHRELLGGTVVGRHAPLAGALIATSGYGLLMGAGVSAGMLAAGQPAVGSLATGASWAGLALVATAVGALAAQLVENPRTARGMAGGAVALFYLLRIAGDVGGGGWAWLSSISPVGWMHSVRPFAGERWEIVALFGLTAAVLAAIVFLLEARRDLDAGLLPTRPGRAAATPTLGSPLGLALRIHRGAFFGWATATVVYGVIVGGLGPSMAELLEDNPELREIFERIGGTGAFIDIFLAAGLGIIAFIAAAYAVQAALRLHGEEQSGHTELMLSTPVTRRQHFAAHAVLVAAGPGLAMLIGGVTAGVAYGIVTGPVVSETVRLTQASAVHLPSILVVGAITLALFGRTVRAAPLGWAVIVAFLVLAQLGPVLRLDQWVMNLSPFTHTPTAPGGSVRALPLVAMTLIAVGVAGAGLAMYRRRDAGVG